MSPDFEPDFDLDGELRRVATSARVRAAAPPPSHIRARGQQRHRRRVTAVAVTTAVATVVAGGIALGAATPRRTSEIAPQPTPNVTTQQAPEALDLARLLGADDARYALFGGTWTVVREGSPDSALIPCQQEATTGGEVSAVARRMERAGTDDSGSSATLTQLVERHRDEAGATAAYTEMRGWFGACSPKDVATLPGVGEQSESFAVVGPDGDSQKVAEVGLARSGTDVLLVARVHADSEWDPGVRSVRALLRIAVARHLGTPEPRVDPAALPSAEQSGLGDPDTSAVDQGVRALSEAADGFPCGDEADQQIAAPDEPGRLAAYGRSLTSTRDSGAVNETVIRYADEGTARSAMAVCPDDAPGLFGDAADARSGGSASTTFSGAVRVGTAVAYVRYFRDGATAAEARAVFGAASRALQRVYG